MNISVIVILCIKKALFLIVLPITTSVRCFGHGIASLAASGL